MSNAGDFGLGTNQNYTELIPTLNLICNSAQNRSYLLNLNLVRHKKEVRPFILCYIIKLQKNASKDVM